MRGAFVIRLGPHTAPSQDRFEGLVEEVDSGKELRFLSAKELVEFLGSRFDAVFRSSEELPSDDGAAQTLLREEEP